ncbi:MAG: hypothetical protein IPK59_19140 [Rhodospirillaceae bacterium]|nr:hypothetical protein [Rhodospirillaceae bacterium]
MRLPKAHKFPLYWVVAIGWGIAPLVLGLPPLLRSASDSEELVLVVASIPDNSQLTVPTGLSTLPELAALADADMAGRAQRLYLNAFAVKGRAVSDLAGAASKLSRFESEGAPECPFLANGFWATQQALAERMLSMQLSPETQSPFDEPDDGRTCGSEAALWAFSQNLRDLSKADWSANPEGVAKTAEIAKNALDLLAASNVKEELLRTARTVAAEERKAARQWKFIGLVAYLAGLWSLILGAPLLRQGIIAAALKKRRQQRNRNLQVDRLRHQLA